MQKYFQRLEETLKKRGVKKTALAAHLHVALSTISRWQHAMPRVETIQATAEFLGVSAQWLTTGEVGNAGEPIPKPESTDMAMLVSYVNPNENQAPEKKNPPAEDRILKLESDLSLVKLELAFLKGAVNAMMKTAGRQRESGAASETRMKAADDPAPYRMQP